MKLKKLTTTFVKNKTVLYRSPYDISIKEINGEFIISDDSRIKVTIPTLKFLLENNCKIVILTWVKRPENKDPKLSTKPIAVALEKLLNHKVEYINDCIGPTVGEKIKSLKPTEILMLENSRYYKEDLIEDLEFSKKLCIGSDVIVFDAFPQAHRAASSVTGILKVLPSVSGYYLQQEVDALEKVMIKPEHPFTLIIGGAKISDKVNALENLIKEADYVLVGGGPAHAFLVAKGINVASSILEDNFLDEMTGKNFNVVTLAKELLENYKEKIILPIDFVIGNDRKNPTIVKEINIIEQKNIPSGFAALDIGKKAIENFIEIIKKSKTIFWNGPMGLFEDERFENGTKSLALEVSKINGTTVIAGGDTIDAINNYNISDKITHISVAGSATLEFLGGTNLPALELLKE